MPFGPQRFLAALTNSFEERLLINQRNRRPRFYHLSVKSEKRKRTNVAWKKFLRQVNGVREPLGSAYGASWRPIIWTLLHDAGVAFALCCINSTIQNSKIFQMPLSLSLLSFSRPFSFSVYVSPCESDYCINCSRSHAHRWADTAEICLLIPKTVCRPFTIYPLFPLKMKRVTSPERPEEFRNKA